MRPVTRKCSAYARAAGSVAASSSSSCVVATWPYARIASSDGIAGASGARTVCTWPSRSTVSSSAAPGATAPRPTASSVWPGNSVVGRPASRRSVEPASFTPVSRHGRARCAVAARATSASPVTENTAPPDSRARCASAPTSVPASPVWYAYSGPAAPDASVLPSACRFASPHVAAPSESRNTSWRAAPAVAAAAPPSHAGLAASASAAPRSVAPSSASDSACAITASTLAGVFSTNAPACQWASTPKNSTLKRRSESRLRPSTSRRSASQMLKRSGLELSDVSTRKHGGVTRARGRGRQRRRDLRGEHVAEARLAAHEQRRARALEAHRDGPVRRILEVEALAPRRAGHRGSCHRRRHRHARAARLGHRDVHDRPGRLRRQLEAVLERVADPHEVHVVADDDPVQLPPPGADTRAR